MDITITITDTESPALTRTPFGPTSEPGAELRVEVTVSDVQGFALPDALDALGRTAAAAFTLVNTEIDDEPKTESGADHEPPLRESAESIIMRHLPFARNRSTPDKNIAAAVIVDLKHEGWIS